MANYSKGLRPWLFTPEAIEKSRITKATRKYKESIGHKISQGIAQMTPERKAEKARRNSVSQPRAKHSARMKLNNPMYNAESREKVKQTILLQRDAISERMKKLWSDGRLHGHPQGEHQRQASSQRMKENNPMWKPEVALRVSNVKRQRWKKNHLQMAQAWIRAGQSPNKLEQRLDILIKPLGFRFVGGGDFWIGPCRSGHCRNPDFIYGTGKERIAILANGSYWHCVEGDKAELLDYQSYGWEVMVIWEEEIQNTLFVVSKIKNWLNGLELSQFGEVKEQIPMT